MFCILDTIEEQYTLGEKFWSYFTNFLIEKKYCMYEFQLDSVLFQHQAVCSVFLLACKNIQA